MSKHSMEKADQIYEVLASIHRDIRTAYVLLAGKDRLDGIKQGLTAGESLSIIGDRYGISRERVRQIALAYQWPTRPRRDATQQERDAALALLRNGTTITDVAVQLHRSYYWVLQLAHEYKIAVVRAPYPVKPSTTIAAALVAQGQLSNVKIARRVSTDEAQIAVLRQRLRAAGIRCDGPDGRRRKEKVNHA